MAKKINFHAEPLSEALRDQTVAFSLLSSPFISTVTEHLLKSLFLPFIFLFDLAANISKVNQFLKRENKNLENTTQLALSIVSLFFIFSATLCFFIVLNPIVPGCCFIAAIGLGTLYNGSLFIFNLLNRFLGTFGKKTGYLREIYKENVLKYGFAAFIGLSLLTSIVVGTFFAPALGAIIPAAIGIVSGIILFSGSIYSFYKSTNTNVEKRVPPVFEETSLQQQLGNDLKKDKELLMLGIFKQLVFLQSHLNKLSDDPSSQSNKKERNSVEQSIETLIYLAITLFVTHEESKNLEALESYTAEFIQSIQDKMTEEKKPLATQVSNRLLLELSKIVYRDIYRNKETIKDYFLDKAVERYSKVKNQLDGATTEEIESIKTAVKTHHNIEKIKQSDYPDWGTSSAKEFVISNNNHFYKKARRSEELTQNVDQNREFLLEEILKKLILLKADKNAEKEENGKFSKIETIINGTKVDQKVYLLVNLAAFLLALNSQLSEEKLNSFTQWVPFTIVQRIFSAFKNLNSDETLNSQNIDVSIEPSKEFRARPTFRTSRDFDRFKKKYEPLLKAEVFQSFRKQESDVKDLFTAIEKHFDIEKEQSLRETEHEGPSEH